MSPHRPLVGVPTQSLHSLPGVPTGLPASWAMSQRYVTTLAAAGATPIMIPLLPDDADTLRAIYDALDGVFLPGGADLDPASYGEERLPVCDKSDPPRDQVELMLTRWALEDRKPALGVCRGLQILNIAMGGTLYQDIRAQQPSYVKHDYFPGQGHEREYLAHDVRVTGPSRLADVFGVGDLRVNSLHHQGIDRLGAGLLATAVAPDGLVEGVELPSDDHFMVAVQWHPEALYTRDEPTRRLFAAFVEASADYHEHRDQRGAAAGATAASGAR
jgi:putative glutamine amidotransferase